MKNKISALYILFLAFFTAGVLAFADTPGSVPVDKPSTDTQTSYLYDLKRLIDKSRANIKEVNEKIKEQAVLKRNQKREERAREYYEKGVELTNAGKLDEAREYFEKAIRITEHPEMTGYIRESQRRLRKQENALQSQERQHYNQIKQDENSRKEDVEAAYKEAVDLYKQKKYHPAKDAFEHVDEIVPDYRATSSYLKIIDQDIIMADALAAKQQGIEIVRQQKEAESARAKEKEMWRQQIDEKEKERKEAIDRQAQEVYDEAIVLYKNKKFAEAKKKFEEVSWVIPDYKATIKYLARIDRDAQQEQERVGREQQKVLQEQRWEQEVERKKQETEKSQELEAKERQHKKDLQEQAGFLYQAAVTLFNQKKMDEALEKFNDIERLSPDFKSTRIFIARIEQKKAQASNAKVAVVVTPAAQTVAPPVTITPAVLPVPVAPYVAALLPPVPVASLPAPVASPSATVKPTVSPIEVEDQQKQAAEIAALAEKSSQLYHQIVDIADDSSTVQVKRKMAEVDKILNNLKEDKGRLLRQMQGEQWRRQQEESKAKQEERRLSAEKLYHDGVEYLRSHDYSKAKIKFLELENVIPDYKSTRRYLSRIDEDLKRSNIEAVTGYEKNQAGHLKQLQDKENTAEQLRHQQDQEKRQQVEQQEQVSLKELAQKASDINDDIIRLSKSQDYTGMKAKFVELENTVTALTTLKDEMANEKGRQARDKQLAHESIRRRNEMIRAQKREDREIQSYYGAQPLKEYRPVLSNQPSDVDQYKHREIMQEQNVLFSEAVDRYEHKKYTQAKLLFGELAQQNDRRAEAWLKKVDHAITRELLTSQEGEERERTAFLADQLKAQHELIAIQERERQRQKKLTEELERQKRLYEDDRLLQLRKEEMLKAQERERQHQEEKRLKLEKENEKQQESLRFHKIIPQTHPAAPAAPVVAPVIPAPPAVAAAKPKPSELLTPRQIKAQVDFSNKRKTFLDNQYKKQQQEQARLTKIKAKEEERQKRREEKARQAKAQAEKSAQEQKRREEILQQRGQEREEKIKQDKIMREETQRRQEMERQERQHQAQLEAQREAVRKQLEDGVEAMYREALDLYKQGNYMAAADKFKDVQDILPGYKRSEQYMDAARQKSLSVQPQGATVPDSSEDLSEASASSHVAVASQPTHQDDVSKALDIFDQNAK